MSTAVVQHLPIVGLTPSAKEVNTAEIRPAIACNSIELAAAINQALTRAGMNNKQAAAWMEIDPGQWSRQLQGEGHISFQRLLKLPIKFWTEFVPLLAEPIGLNCSHEDIADRALLQAAATIEQLTRAVVQMRAERRIA